MCDTMGDYWRLGKEEQRERRERIEPLRMYHAETKLLNLGWEVKAGPDETSFTVISPAGKRFNFWPYKGYFAGPVQGRGLRNLIKAGK
jgi:hypothetical protein